MRIPTFLVMTGMMMSACAPRVDSVVEEEAVRAIGTAWQAFDDEQNAAGVAGLFAADGSAYWEGRQPAIGPQEIELFMSESYAFDPGGEGSWGSDRLHLAASGDLAVEEGAFQSPVDQGRYITVYKKVGDAWKIAADMSVSTAPDGGAPAWALELLDRWYETFNARDAAALADTYTSDAVVGDARGRRAITARFEAGWAESDAVCSGQFDGFEVRGTIATGWGRDTCVTAGEGGGGTTERSNWLAVYEQQTDGSWLCIRDYGEPVAE
jgi:ketosteroid isomerase-like protein